MWCMPRKCKKEAKLLLSLFSTIDHLNDYQFLDLKLQFPETLHYYEINLRKYWVVSKGPIGWILVSCKSYFLIALVFLEDSSAIKFHNFLCEAKWLHSQLILSLIPETDINSVPGTGPKNTQVHFLSNIRVKLLRET